MVKIDENWLPPPPLTGEVNFENPEKKVSGINKRT
jgi:hypothetical protein